MHFSFYRPSNISVTPEAIILNLFFGGFSWNAPPNVTQFVWKFYHWCISRRCNTCYGFWCSHKIWKYYAKKLFWIITRDFLLMSSFALRINSFFAQWQVLWRYIIRVSFISIYSICGCQIKNFQSFVPIQHPWNGPVWGFFGNLLPEKYGPFFWNFHQNMNSTGMKSQFRDSILSLS